MIGSYPQNRTHFHAFQRRQYDVCVRPRKSTLIVGITRLMAQLVAIKEPRDFRLRAKILAEDMGLELVCMVQTLKIQGGNTPSTFVPRVVPKYRHTDYCSLISKPYFTSFLPNSLIVMKLPICIVPTVVLASAVLINTRPIAFSRLAR